MKVQHFGIIDKLDTHVLTTVKGTAENNNSAFVTFRLPVFSLSLELEWECDVIGDVSNTSYNMILVRDILKALKWILILHGRF